MSADFGTLIWCDVWFISFIRTWFGPSCDIGWKVLEKFKNTRPLSLIILSLHRTENHRIRSAFVLSTTNATILQLRTLTLKFHSAKLHFSTSKMVCGVEAMVHGNLPRLLLTFSRTNITTHPRSKLQHDQRCQSMSERFIKHVEIPLNSQPAALRYQQRPSTNDRGERFGT